MRNLRPTRNSHARNSHARNSDARNSNARQGRPCIFVAAALLAMSVLASCGGGGAAGNNNSTNTSNPNTAPGCDPDPECHTLAFGGITRSYLLHVPANFVPGTSALVIGLHGSQGSGAMFR